MICGENASLKGKTPGLHENQLHEMWKNEKTWKTTIDKGRWILYTVTGRV